MTIADTLRHLGLASPDPRSDGELVTRFVANRDELAFAELLRRHGPTVYGVCRRVVGNSPDADDAFQAVFLVLARKAGNVRPPGMVGHWLYGVAVRTANKARVMNAKRTRREGTPHPPGAAPQTAPGGCGAPSDTLAVIDAELASLPDVYRAAFVACELNGRSRSEAARELGWPEGTVAARLAKARQLLAARLTKRGVTLGAGLFAAAAVPSATAADTLSAVRELLAVGTASAVAPAAQSLSDEVARTMNPLNWKLAAVGLVALALIGGGTALVAGGPEKRPVREPIKAPVPKAAPSDWKEAEGITFKDGGRVTCVAFAPSGKTLAVCRDGGQIDFFDPATRTHQQSMQLKNDPKANPNTEVGTVTALAFRPTPHDKLGDVFAVTHKNGVNFGTTTLGLLADDAPAVEGVPPNWELKGVNPRQVLWPADHYMVATNGVEGWTREEVKGKWLSHASDNENGERGRPMPLANLPNSTCYLASSKWKHEVNDIHAVPTGLLASSPAWKLVGHKARPVAVAASADGKRIVSADAGGTLIVWEGEKSKFEEKRRIEQGPGLAGLALAPDGKTLAAVRVYTDKSLLGTSGQALFNLEIFAFDVSDPPAKPKPLWSVRNVLSDPKTITGPASLAFSPDGTTLLAAFADPYITGKDAKSMGVKVWTLGEQPIKAPVPKAVSGEWNERDAITFKDGGRVTSVAFAPSGKTLAVCRDGGQIDFFDPATRTHQQSMQLKNDPKVNPNTEVGTVTALAFRPTPHDKLGDVFAVSHKNGVNFGTTDIGLLADDAAAVEGVPPNWELKRTDPHRVTWLTAKGESERLAITNGSNTATRRKEPGDSGLQLFGWKESFHRPVPFIGLSDGKLLTALNDPENKDAATTLYVVTDDDKRTLMSGHKARPVAAAVAADDKRILSADERGTLIVWEGEKSKFDEKRRLELGEGVVQLALAPDGKTVAVARVVPVEGSEVKGGWRFVEAQLLLFDVTDPPAKPKPLWSERIGQDWRKINGPVSLAFRPDGKTLLAAFGDPYNSGEDDKGVWHTGLIPSSVGVKVWELMPKK